MLCMCVCFVWNRLPACHKYRRRRRRIFLDHRHRSPIVLDSSVPPASPPLSPLSPTSSSHEATALPDSYHHVRCLHPSRLFPPAARFSSSTLSPLSRSPPPPPTSTTTPRARRFARSGLNGSRVTVASVYATLLLATLISGFEYRRIVVGICASENAEANTLEYRKRRCVCRLFNYVTK